MTMLEKVAMALEEMADLNGCSPIHGENWARSALEAMRGPSPEMVEAAHTVLAGDNGKVEDVYTAMIDAALKEKVG